MFQEDKRSALECPGGLVPFKAVGFSHSLVDKSLCAAAVYAVFCFPVEISPEVTAGFGHADFGCGTVSTYIADNELQERFCQPVCRR